MLLPQETEVSVGDIKQKTKVVYYKLNEAIDMSEFRPPTFITVKDPNAEK